LGFVSRQKSNIKLKKLNDVNSKIVFLRNTNVILDSDVAVCMAWKKKAFIKAFTKISEL
jgi:hypothetical protein